MNQPVTRAEFDALYNVVMALNASLDANRSTTGALVESQVPLGEALNLLPAIADALEKLQQQTELLRAVFVGLLRLADPHAPPSLQGGIAAALRELENPR